MRILCSDWLISPVTQVMYWRRSPLIWTGSTREPALAQLQPLLVDDIVLEVSIVVEWQRRQRVLSFTLNKEYEFLKL